MRSLSALCVSALWGLAGLTSCGGGDDAPAEDAELPTVGADASVDALGDAVVDASLVCEPAATPACPETPAPTFGPDLFGYTASRSSSVCAFSFIDISLTGKALVLGDDKAATVTLAKPVVVYGAEVPQMVVASNGYISTNIADRGPDLTNDCALPAPPSTPIAAAGHRLYPLHDDLVTAQGFYEWFPCCPRPSASGQGVGCHVFQWNDAYHFGDLDPETHVPLHPFDFQVVIYDVLWEMAFQYPAGNPEHGAGSTTGLLADEHPGSESYADGLLVSCDTVDSIPDESAVCFFHPDAPDPCL